MEDRDYALDSSKESFIKLIETIKNLTFKLNISPVYKAPWNFLKTNEYHT